jgi:hypothetical protein
MMYQPNSEDIVVCECGCDEIITVNKAVKIASPLVGQPSTISILGVVRFKCSHCGNVWLVDDSKNVRESKPLLIGV